MQLESKLSLDSYAPVKTFQILILEKKLNTKKVLLPNKKI